MAKQVTVRGIADNTPPCDVGATSKRVPIVCIFDGENEEFGAPRRVVISAHDADKICAAIKHVAAQALAGNDSRAEYDGADTDATDAD